MKWQKIGEGHVASMDRLGLKEVRNAANPSRESVADTDIGLYGTATQLEVNQDRGNMGRDGEQEAVSLDDLRAKGQEARQAGQTHGKDGPDLGRQHGRGV